MDDVTLDAQTLRESWRQVGDWRMTPITRGANNLILRVDDPATPAAHVLRVYRNHADQRRLRHELGVMSALAAMDLPFLVPAPIPTVTGNLWRRLSLGDDVVAIATLWPLVSGAHPRRDALGQAHAAGSALATLDGALARVSLPVHPESDMPPPMLERARSLPAGVDVAGTLRRLPLRPETPARILALMAAVEEQAPPVLATLPRQLIHSDYDPSNVLMEGERVTGVLDFEFSTVDARIAELGAPLMWWPIEIFGTGNEWPIIAAFGQGYSSIQPLADAEIAALPLILRIRYVGSMLHRFARHARGLTSIEELTRRVESTLWRDGWLATNERRLVEQVAGWR